jgi:ComF family protein
LLCARCRDGFSPIRAPLCARCGAPTAWPVERCLECSGRRLAFVSARAAVVYDGPARPFLRAWKEGGLRPLARVAAELVVEHVPRPAADVIAYIPADGDRSLRRGHQPAYGLARELGRQWSLEVAPLVMRRREVGRQTGLALAERRKNMRGAFGAASQVPSSVVLVDDVYTTGATVGSAATALRAAGAARVEVISFARAVR